MPGRRSGAAQIVATAHQIAEPFGLRGRWLNEAQLASAIEPHQLLRIPPVSLDPVAGADRDQRRRDDVARDPKTRQQPVQIEPTGPAS